MATTKNKPKLEFEPLIIQLAVPFDLSEIRWRVTRTNENGSRGAVVPYADPRAYTDRLNEVVTPRGWTRTFDVFTVPSMRMKDGKLIHTGKVLVASKLTIPRIGCHTGSGEAWADEQHALAAADAQSLKRACSNFGLGRYLYSLAEVWVALDPFGQPLETPTLPQWALRAPTDATRKSNPAAGPRPTMVQRSPLDQEAIARIAGFEQVVGKPIYQEILGRIAHAQRADEIPNAQLLVEVADAMERAARGIDRAHSLAEEIGDMRLIPILGRFQIRSMSSIRNLEALRHLVEELEILTGQQAA